MQWWVILAWQLIKLLPEVIDWVRKHPFQNKKDAVLEFKDRVHGVIGAEYTVGVPTEIKKI